MELSLITFFLIYLLFYALQKINVFSDPGPFVEPNLKFKMLLKARACSLNERATMVLIEYKILYRVKDSISRSRGKTKGFIKTKSLGWAELKTKGFIQPLAVGWVGGV